MLMLHAVLVEECEKMSEARFAALRADIHEGLDSGAAVPLDMTEIKETTRRSRNGTRVSVA